MAQKIFTTDSWNEFTAGMIDLSEKVKSTNIAYGTCSTAAATVEKVITISGDYNWKLEIGSIIVVKFSATNTAKNPTFNVNGTGAKSVWYNTALITTTSSTLGYAGTANRPMMFMYDGTQYVFISWAYDTNSTYSNASLGQGYGTCETAEATTAKVVTLSSYSATTGGVVAVKFTYAVPANATMNINSKGAKNIFYRGAAITAGIIKAGDIGVFIYDGTQYHLLTVDRDEDTTYTLGSFGVTATASELNVLDGITATTTELNYVDGVTSNIQTQIDNITNGTKTVSKATSATSATYATTATKAGSATSATNASTAEYASLANKATSATSATYASTATKAGTANSASTATVDSKGQAITSYIKGFGINGKTITITKGDGSTATYTTQDTDTTYSNYKGATTAASGTPGLVPAATTATRTSFLRGDGTWATPSSATSATMATSATKASSAVVATSATYATSADSANKATSATSATYASTANYAKNAPTYKGATTAASGTPGLVPAATTATRTSFLRGDGTWVTPTDAKVAQAELTSNSDRSILLASNNTTASATTGTYKSTKLKYNPSTNILTVGTVNGNLTGLATSATNASTANFSKSSGIEITQEAYDALVNAGTVDHNAVYYITDSNSYVNGWRIEQVTALPSDAASKTHTLYVVG